MEPEAIKFTGQHFLLVPCGEKLHSLGYFYKYHLSTDGEIGIRITPVLREFSPPRTVYRWKLNHEGQHIVFY